jgi:hypothetical protein
MNRKRLLVIATILTVVILIAVFLYNPNIFRRNGSISTVTALPESAVCFYKGKDFNESYKQFSATALWMDLLNLSSVKSTDSLLNIIFLKIQSNPTLNKKFQNDQTIISLHQTSPGSISPLLLMLTNGKFTYDEVDAILKPDITGKLLQRTYQGVKIYDYQLNTRKSQVVFAITDGVFMISSNPLLLEDAISTFKKNRTAKNYYFKTVIENNPGASFYINYKQINSFINIFTDPETQTQINNLQYFGSLGSYELTINSEFQLLRGNISNLDIETNFLTLFQGQSAGKIDVQRILSSKTSVLLAYNLDNLNLYYSNYLKRIKNRGLLEQYNKDKFRLETKYNISIDGDILPLLDGPFALALDEVLTDDITRATALLVKVSETDKALEFFYKPSAGNDTFKTGVIEKYREFTIYGSQLSEMFYLIYGNCFTNIGYTYYTNIRDYLIFCPDLAHLHSLIDDYLAQKLLVTSTGFTKVNDKIGSESNMLLYINPILAIHIPEVYTNNPWLGYYQKNIGYLKKFEFLAFQISNSSEGIYSEIVAKYSQANAVMEGGTVWETKLDTNYILKPFVVKNHNTGSNEIVVFDVSNKMYLIDGGGKIIWKKQLESPMMGELSQVDYFDNDKLQYLFSTEKMIHLIDRNGMEVANYPLRLQAKASSGLAMFNFSSNNNYIFFAGCVNNSIYGYAKTGKLLAGWSPKKIMGSLSMPLKYFINNGKTYYLGVSNKGVFYFLGARGEDIVKPLDLKTNFRNPFFMKPDEELNKTSLISVDTNGKCYFVYPSGKAEIQQLGKWSSAMFFDYSDINNDGVKELLFAENNNIASFTTEGKAVMSIILDNPILDRPTYISIKKKNYIAYLNSETQSVFLVDYEGNIYRNFPIPCQSPFLLYDLNKDDNIELIGGKGNTIFLSRF